MNNKGFMMAEVVVVSAIILVFMTGMYVSYNKVFSAYNTRIDYYDINTFYKLAYYESTLVGASDYDEVDKPGKLIYEIVNDDDETIYLMHNQKTNIDGSLKERFNSEDVNVTFKEYIEYLSTAVDLNDTEYVLVMEKCSYTDNCKYAYLEVGDAS